MAIMIGDPQGKNEPTENTAADRVDIAGISFRCESVDVNNRAGMHLSPGLAR